MKRILNEHVKCLHTLQALTLLMTVECSHNDMTMFILSMPVYCRGLEVFNTKWIAPNGKWIAHEVNLAKRELIGGSVLSR